MDKKEYAINRNKEISDKLDDFLNTSLSNKGDIEALINHYKIAGLYTYSLINSVMIKMQGGTICQSFKNWQKLNRNVKKGEKGNILIYVPLFIKKEKKDNNDEIIDTWEKLFFKLKPVFDISQTEGEELKFNHNTNNISDIKYTDIKNKLQKIVTQKILENPLSESRGYCSNSEIVISSISNNIDSIKTLIHEVAHSLFNHVNSEKERGLKEIEAESVSYLVMSYLGIDYSLSSEYVNNWKNHTNSEVKKTDIIKHTDKIIKAIKE